MKSVAVFKPEFQLTKNYFIVILLIVFSYSAKAQSVGINTLTPNPSAALDIESTTGGLLIPRMTTAQISALSSPADGLMVYNSDIANTVMFYQGTPYELYNKGAGTVITVLSGIAPTFWTSISHLSLTEFLGLDIHRMQVDLSEASELRITANVSGVTLGLGGSLSIALQYSTDGGSTWTYVDSNSFGPELSISVDGLIVTPWTDIDLAARQDVQLRLVGRATGGVITQVGLGMVMLEIR
ncbi:hypothetical protein [uncultured Zobellia sp.]|uniref:hypothetical protein n=1 Tax=uncultured Zobellia sp. TaxID=255433 RepID=UPI002593FB59|nr:hypothetical protein [uncultured Zobellia sp.]